MAVVGGKPAFVGLLNHAATATITPSEEAAGYDGDNLKIPAYSSGATAGGKGTWRSTGVTAGRTVDFDLGALKTDIEAIILWGVNLTDAATWRIIGDNTAGFGSPEHDSGTISVFDVTRTPPAGLDDTPPWGRPAIYLPAATWSARYIRITLTDTANGDGYLEAAHASIGPVWQPGAAATWATGAEWIGELGVSVPKNGHTFTFMHVIPAIRRQVAALSRAMQGVGRFGIIPHPDTAAAYITDAFLGRLRVPPEETPLPGVSEWNINLQVEEVTS
jgi:hypothetical protein